jgi:hypothetical protein
MPHSYSFLSQMADRNVRPTAGSWDKHSCLLQRSAEKSLGWN